MLCTLRVKLSSGIMTCTNVLCTFTTPCFACLKLHYMYPPPPPLSYLGLPEPYMYDVYTAFSQRGLTEQKSWNVTFLMQTIFE